MWAIAGAPQVPEAPAPSPTLDVSWQAPAQCPDRAEVTERVARHLATSQQVGAARVRGRVESVSSGYALSLEVEVDGRTEASRMEASECELVTRAGVLVTAVAVDALATASELSSAPVVPAPIAAPTDVELELPNDAASVPPRSQPSRAPTRSLSPPRARPTSRLELSASGGVGVGLVPAVTGGLELEGGWGMGALKIEAGAYHWFARLSEVEPGASIRAALTGGWMHGCGAWRGRVVEVPICGGVDLAASHGRGTGSRVDPQDASDVWVALTAGIGLRWWIRTRFALVARADVLASLRQPGMYLTIDGARQEAFRMPPTGFRLLVGGRIRVWEGKPRRRGAR